MIKQVILFRKDLNMRMGKVAAQAAHASMKVFLDRKLRALGGELPARYLEVAGGRPEFPEDTDDFLMAPLDSFMREWVQGSFAKIVLSVEDEETLMRAYELAKEAGLPVALVEDQGRTEFHGVVTRTTIAIGPAPSEKIDPITGPGGLVPTKLA